MRLLEALLDLAGLGDRLLLGLPRGLHRRRALAQLRQLALDRLATGDRGSSFSFYSAWCSISSCITRRSTSSISVGSESISIRSREAASSIRSIALSGRKRSAM